MGKPKTEKQSLQDFLKGDAFGDGNDWADDEFDISNVYDVKATTSSTNFGDSESGMGSFRREPRQRVEYPVPEVAPFKAHVNNLPWDTNQEEIVSYFTENVEGGDSAITDIYVPLQDDNTVKGVAFITFGTKDQLLQALDMSGQEFNGRKVYVNVAAPGREGPSRGGRFNQDSFDWSARRDPHEGEPRRTRRFDDDEERAPMPEFDWSARRGPLPETDENRPPRRTNRRPPREGEDLDWSTRDNDKPRRSRRFGDDEERAPMPELDWSAKRGPLPETDENRPPRRTNRRPPREGEDLDWSTRDNDKPRRNRKFGDDEERAPIPEFDWSARRGPLPDLENDHASRRPEKHYEEGKKGKRFGKDRTPQPQLDWSARRGPLSDEDAKSGFTKVGSKSSRKGAVTQTAKPEVAENTSADASKSMQSSFALLSVEDDE